MHRRLIDRIPDAKHSPASDPELVRLLPLLLAIVRQARFDARSDEQARAWLEELCSTTTKRVRRVA